MELSTFARVTDTSPNQNGLVKGESNGAAPITTERTSSVPRDYDEISSEPDQSPTEPKVITYFFKHCTRLLYSFLIVSLRNHRPKIKRRLRNYEEHEDGADEDSD